MDLIAKQIAKRRAAGLFVSYDRTTPEETAAYARATIAFASVKERDEELDRLAWLGRNPRIEH
jgi:hypothetical protein